MTAIVAEFEQFKVLTVSVQLFQFLSDIYSGNYLDSIDFDWPKDYSKLDSFVVLFIMPESSVNLAAVIKVEIPTAWANFHWIADYFAEYCNFTRFKLNSSFGLKASIMQAFPTPT